MIKELKTTLYGVSTTAQTHESQLKSELPTECLYTLIVAERVSQAFRNILKSFFNGAHGVP